MTSKAFCRLCGNEKLKNITTLRFSPLANSCRGDDNSQYLSDLKPDYAPDLRQPSLLKQTPMRTTYGTNADDK